MKIKLSKIRQLMGRLVIVEKVARREKKYVGTTPGSAVIAHAINPRAGWVTGIRWLRDGLRCWEGSEVGYQFDAKGPAVPYLLVAFWPTQNPVKVPMDGWRLRKVLPEAENPDPLPWDGQWSELERSEQRYIMEATPRDEKGRFV